MWISFSIWRRFPLSHVHYLHVIFSYKQSKCHLLSGTLVIKKIIIPWHLIFIFFFSDGHLKQTSLLNMDTLICISLVLTDFGKVYVIFNFNLRLNFFWTILKFLNWFHFLYWFHFSQWLCFLRLSHSLIYICGDVFL